MLRVITINVNGIRSAAKKNFFSWLKKQKADIVCIQETKAQQSQLQDSIFSPAGYHAYFADAVKKGYSGVAMYCKTKPNKVSKGLGWQTADEEGRYLQADFDKFSVVSIYLPSGTSGDERQQVKYEFLEKYAKVLKKQIKQSKPLIICGDINIAHNNIDLKNWRSNQKNSGFLPDERAWLDQLFSKIGFIDAFRHKNPDKVEYTWWSNRANAWQNNVGWRIDYQIISPQLSTKIINTQVYRAEKFSDHAPLTIDYDIRNVS